MRISEIKRIYWDHPKGKAIQILIGHTFWQDAEYRNALSNKLDKADLDAMFTIIRNVTLKKLSVISEDPQKAIEEGKDVITPVKKLSKAIYDKPGYWAYGTKYEAIIRGQEQAQSESHRAKLKRYDDLYPVRCRLKLMKRKRSSDIFWSIALNEGVAEAILTREAEQPIASREELYEIADEVVQKQLLDETFVHTSYYIIRTLSSIVFHDREYWENSLSDPKTKEALGRYRAEAHPTNTAEGTANEAE